ncbi:hypothetical protein BGX31_001864 [Mortierella sp. GBA43]|nr:hypothetical protein BGX31_001864 [Mortierella sp. GBA43]
MVFGSIVSSPRGSLSFQQSLHLANLFLDSAGRTQDRDVVLALCHETEAALSHAKKAAKHGEDKTMRQGVGNTYIGLGRVLESQEHRTEAQAIYKKAEKMGVKIQEQGQLAQSLDSKHKTQVGGPVHSTADVPAVQHSPYGPPGKRRQGEHIATTPSHIFSENVRPTTIAERLPEPDERLTNTPQLACCLALLQDSHLLDSILEPAARNWLLAVENDEDEQERLKVLAMDVIRAFKKEEIKDAKAVSEVVCLAPVLEKDAFRDLLVEFYNGIDHQDCWTFIDSKDLLR